MSLTDQPPDLETKAPIDTVAADIGETALTNTDKSISDEQGYPRYDSKGNFIPPHLRHYPNGQPPPSQPYNPPQPPKTHFTAAELADHYGSPHRGTLTSSINDQNRLEYILIFANQHPNYPPKIFCKSNLELIYENPPSAPRGPGIHGGKNVVRGVDYDVGGGYNWPLNKHLIDPDFQFPVFEEEKIPGGKAFVFAGWARIKEVTRLPAGSEELKEMLVAKWRSDTPRTRGSAAAGANATSSSSSAAAATNATSSAVEALTNVILGKTNNSVEVTAMRSANTIAPRDIRAAERDERAIARKTEGVKITKSSEIDKHGKERITETIILAEDPDIEIERKEQEEAERLRKVYTGPEPQKQHQPQQQDRGGGRGWKRAPPGRGGKRGGYYGRRKGEEEEALVSGGAIDEKLAGTKVRSGHAWKNSLAVDWAVVELEFLETTRGNPLLCEEKVMLKPASPPPPEELIERAYEDDQEDGGVRLDASIEDIVSPVEEMVIVDKEDKGKGKAKEVIDNQHDSQTRGSGGYTPTPAETPAPMMQQEAESGFMTSGMSLNEYLMPLVRMVQWQKKRDEQEAREAPPPVPTSPPQKFKDKYNAEAEAAAKEEAAKKDGDGKTEEKDIGGSYITGMDGSVDDLGTMSVASETDHSENWSEFGEGEKSQQMPHHQLQQQQGEEKKWMAVERGGTTKEVS